MLFVIRLQRYCVSFDCAKIYVPSGNFCRLQEPYFNMDIAIHFSAAFSATIEQALQLDLKKTA